MTPTLTTLQQRCTLCPECEQRWQWPGALQQGRYAAMIRRGTSRVDYAGNPFARLIT